jgi:hypothetical protein
MTRMLIQTPEASFSSLSTLLQEILEHEGYEMIEAANSYEGFQATGMALSHGVTLDAQYFIVW